MEYITPKEAGELWGISERRVQYLCANGQIDEGKRLGGKVWVIPADASEGAIMRFGESVYYGTRWMSVGSDMMITKIPPIAGKYRR